MSRPFIFISSVFIKSPLLDVIKTVQEYNAQLIELRICGNYAHILSEKLVLVNLQQVLSDGAAFNAQSHSLLLSYASRVYNRRPLNQAIMKSKIIVLQ